jgi:hypothetical protein
VIADSIIINMAHRIDDPDNLNAFLRLIHGTPLSASPNARLAAVAQVRLKLTLYISPHKIVTDYVKDLTSYCDPQRHA